MEGKKIDAEIDETKEALHPPGRSVVSMAHSVAVLKGGASANLIRPTVDGAEPLALVNSRSTTR